MQCGLQRLSKRVVGANDGIMVCPLIGRERGRNFMRTKPGDALDCGFDVFGGDQPGAFELPRRAGMARTPQKVLVIETMPRVVPAAVAGMPVDHPVRRREFVGRMREATDQHHRTACRPRQPRQPAAQPDETRRMPQPARPLGQWPVARLILHAVREVGPHQAAAVCRFLVDTNHPVAARLEELHHLTPAMRVAPVFAPAAALHRDTDIGLVDRPTVVRQREAGRFLGRIDAQDVAGSAVQPDMAKVNRLPDIVRVVEKQTQAVGGVGCVR